MCVCACVYVRVSKPKSKSAYILISFNGTLLRTQPIFNFPEHFSQEKAKTTRDLHAKKKLEVRLYVCARVRVDVWM